MGTQGKDEGLTGHLMQFVGKEAEKGLERKGNRINLEEEEGERRKERLLDNQMHITRYKKKRRSG